MIRFMICDTDPEFLNKLAATLHNNFDPCTVEYMYGPSALEVSLRSDSGGADVLLTEIELRDQSSISIHHYYSTTDKYSISTSKGPVIKQPLSLAKQI